MENIECYRYRRDLEIKTNIAVCHPLRVVHIIKHVLVPSGVRGRGVYAARAFGGRGACPVISYICITMCISTSIRYTLIARFSRRRVPAYITGGHRCDGLNGVRGLEGRISNDINRFLCNLRQHIQDVPKLDVNPEPGENASHVGISTTRFSRKIKLGLLMRKCTRYALSPFRRSLLAACVSSDFVNIGPLTAAARPQRSARTPRANGPYPQPARTYVPKSC
ncbi:hypothetical protein EVAR_80918_1 [Eumeta japonica]|uniref:Uncharacterized protein n=1 Tax=Eumeta variegata TaxID=151549 RepID=A0A4C1V092_EUMVA|nr:hypothetical protein EVAR_80918_1 [Eumeta japonica]